MANEEIWLPVVGYEGFYEVSSVGRVRSLNRVVYDGRGYGFPKKGKEMMHHVDKSGYHLVNLSNGKSHGYLVHRLVAIAFIPNPNNCREVNHIDGNKNNNCIENLEWCSHKQNMVHSVVAGVRGDCIVVKDLETGTIYPSVKDAARRSGTPESTIRLRLKQPQNGKWVTVNKRA